MLTQPVKDTYGIADLDSFRKQVITLPIEQHASSGNWIFKQRMHGFQKERVNGWIKNMLSHDDYGYPKPEIELPDHQAVENAYSEILDNLLQEIIFRDDLCYSMQAIPSFQGRKNKTINWVMAYDPIAFGGNENKDGIIATTISLGGKNGGGSKQEYFEDEGAAWKGMVTGRGGQAIRGKIDPVYYLRNLLSKRTR